MMDKLILPQNIATDHWTNALFTIFLFWLPVSHKIKFRQTGAIFFYFWSISSINSRPSDQFIRFTIRCRWVFFLFRKNREIFFRRDLLFFWSFLFSFSSLLIFLYSRSSLRCFRFREAYPLFRNGIDTSIGDSDIVWSVSASVDKA